MLEHARHQLGYKRDYKLERQQSVQGGTNWLRGTRVPRRRGCWLLAAALPSPPHAWPRRPRDARPRSQNPGPAGLPPALMTTRDNANPLRWLL